QIENCGVQIFHRQTSDLSLSGMSFLDNEANYKIGDAVEIELKKTTFFGTVKRISQSNQIAGLVYVIQFADLEPHQKSILMEELFLSKRVWQYWHVRKSHRYLLSMLLTPLIKSRRFILEWFRESRLEMFNLGSFSRLTNNTNSPASDAGWLKKRTP
ncbi:MAG: PilZ domain-containing protein, partial [Proteobacteria bacterium]|nr:PilZ domain-containing protein [Pseudomonadota bacterium]